MFHYWVIFLLTMALMWFVFRVDKQYTNKIVDHPVCESEEWWRGAFIDTYTSGDNLVFIGEDGTEYEFTGVYVK